MGIASSQPAHWPQRAVIQHSKYLVPWLHVAAVVALALALSAPEELLSSSAQVNVSAVVPKRVAMRVGAAPQVLRITRADIARGWVEVPEPTVIWVRTNSDDGFRLDLDVRGGYVSQLSMRGLSHEAVVGPAGGSVVQPGHLRSDTRFELRWRLRLDGTVQEGDHPWPVHLEASPA